MKKIIFMLLTTVTLFSCGGGSNSNSSTPDSKEKSSGLIAKDLNYKMLSDEAEVKKVMDGVLAKIGNNISKLDKIDIYISRPSKEGLIKKDKPDYATITLTYLDPNNAKKLFECRYSSEKEEWNKGESKSVRVIIGDEETFVLAEEVYDASALTSDMVALAAKEAWSKYKDETKYSDQWVKSIIIKDGEIEVRVMGILSANDQEKAEYYKKKIK